MVPEELMRDLVDHKASMIADVDPHAVPSAARQPPSWSTPNWSTRLVKRPHAVKPRLGVVSFW